MLLNIKYIHVERDMKTQRGFFCFFVFFFVFLVFSKAAPASYGGSQPRGLIGAVDAGLPHNHNNAGSELHL